MKVDRRILLRDFIIVNAAGVSGIFVLLMGILLKKWSYIPEYSCAFLSATHMYCPGCGGTRALFSLLGGDIPASLVYNPSVVLGALIIIYYEVTVVMTIFSRKGRVYYYRNPWPVYVYIAVILVYAVVRDILLVGFGIDLLLS